MTNNVSLIVTYFRVQNLIKSYKRLFIYFFNVDDLKIITVSIFTTNNVMYLLRCLQDTRYISIARVYRWPEGQKSVWHRQPEGSLWRKLQRTQGSRNARGNAL